MPLITVFTPTYNRGYIISRLYESLQRQTSFDFEWLVINDGSTDDTEQLFRAWEQSDNPFAIRYYRTENGGKYRAINRGVDLAAGKLFFIVDSDDWLTEDAIEKLTVWERTISDKCGYAGVSGNRGYSPDELIGGTFDGEYVDATAFERRKRHIIGDKAEAYYTALLMGGGYKFPDFPDQNFATEALLWNRIAADGHRLRWFNKIIYITEYLPDGYTSNQTEIFSKNFNAFAYFTHEQLGYRTLPMIGKIRYLYGYVRIAEYKGMSAYEASGLIGIGRVKYYLFRVATRIFMRIKHRNIKGST
jgi:glycosyltransferase involved in cell wall biosynthesis